MFKPFALSETPHLLHFILLFDIITCLYLKYACKLYLFIKYYLSFKLKLWEYRDLNPSLNADNEIYLT